MCPVLQGVYCQFVRPLHLVICSIVSARSENSESSLGHKHTSAWHDWPGMLVMRHSVPHLSCYEWPAVHAVVNHDATKMGWAMLSHADHT